MSGRHDSGFTLVEVLVAMVLAAMVVAAIGAVSTEASALPG